MAKQALFGGLLLAATLIAGCWAGETRAPTHSAAVDIRPADNAPVENDPAVAIETSVGRTFDIVLSSNASTGYAWVLLDPPSDDRIKRLEKRYLPSAIKRPGAPGVEVWSFAASAPGEVEITLGYQRPWEKNVPPLKLRKYRIDIHP